MVKVAREEGNVVGPSSLHSGGANGGSQVLLVNENKTEQEDNNGKKTSMQLTKIVEEDKFNGDNNGNKKNLSRYIKISFKGDSYFVDSETGAIKIPQKHLHFSNMLPSTKRLLNLREAFVTSADNIHIPLLLEGPSKVTSKSSANPSPKVPVKQGQQHLETISSKEYLDWTKLSPATQAAIDQIQNPGDTRRAVLVICENIEDINLIEAAIERDPNLMKDNAFGMDSIMGGNGVNDGKRLKIFRFDRSYQDFEKGKQSPMEPGDILLGSNITGRGTDLSTSSLLEINGGLHVIVSFLCTNKRIEDQAFGRTARGGKWGTGMYVIDVNRQHFVLDQIQDLVSRDPTLVSIDRLQLIRDDYEVKRIIGIQEDQMPKLEHEKYLFDRFMEFYNKLKPALQEEAERGLKSRYFGNSEELMKEYLELQKKSIKTRWSFWLQKIAAKYFEEDGNPASSEESEANGDTRSALNKADAASDKVASMQQRFAILKEQLDAEYTDFVKELADIVKYNISGDYGKFSGFLSGPTDFLALASMFRRAANSGTDSARSVMDRLYEEIVVRFPQYSAPAHYYRSVMQLRDRSFWDSLWKEAPKKELIQSMKKSLKKLTDIRDIVDSRVQELKKTAEDRIMGTVRRLMNFGGQDEGGGGGR